MFSYPIFGRGHIFIGDISNEVEKNEIEPGLTIAVVLFCIMGPFWLLFRIVRYMLRLGTLLTLRLRRKVRKLASA